MPRDAFLPLTSNVLSRRKIAFGCVAVAIIVIALAVGSHLQIHRLISGYNNLVQQHLGYSYSVTKIQFNIATMSERVEHLIAAANLEQREQALHSITAAEAHVYGEFAVLVKLGVQNMPAVEQSQVLYEKWLSMRQEIYRLLVAGDLNRARQLQQGLASEYLEKLKNNILILDDLTDEKIEGYQIKLERASDHIMLASFVLAVIGIVSVCLLMLHIWRTVTFTDVQRSQRQELIDQQILIATLDREGRTIEVSTALCRLFGCMPEKLVRSYPKFFLGGSESDRQLEKNIMERISQGRKWQGEMTYANAKGETIWAESSILPNYDAQLNLQGFSHILHDLTCKKLANIDKLTGLLNRRSYDEILKEQLSLAGRNKIPIALAILDIDFFKRFNDSYGHPEGDAALKKVSDTLAACMQRPSDFVFRIGGEEFAILISGLDDIKLEAFLNYIRNKIEALNLANKNSTVSPYLTVSIGAAILDKGVETGGDLYKSADRALYRAKTKRNQVLVRTVGDVTSTG